MSTPRSEIPISDSFKKDENEPTRPGTGKDNKCLRKPSSIPTGHKNKVKANADLRSSDAKVEPGDNNAIQRPTSKSRTMPSLIGNIQKQTKPTYTFSGINHSQKRLLENQYLGKKKRYTVVKKELIDKHKNAVDLFEDLNQIRKKVMALGAKDPGKPEEIGPLWCLESEKRLDSIMNSGAGEQIKIPELVTHEFILLMESKLQTIPNSYLSICEEALKKRTEILSWLTEFSKDEKGNEIILDPILVKKVEAFRNEDSNLHEKLDKTNKAQKELIQDLIKKSGVLWIECQNHRVKIKELTNLGEHQFKEKLNNLNDQLKSERDKSNQLKERKTILDSQLQKLRGKVRDLEGQLSSGESKINQFQSSVKQLESQLKQKEASLEQRAKEMQKIAKSNESVISKLEKQKENLESRLTDMTNELTTTKENFKAEVQKSKQKLEDTMEELSQEKGMRLQVEASLAELKERYLELEKKSQLLIEKTKEISKTESSDSSNVNNELRLYNELQAAKATIENQEERIEQLRREREDFVAVMKRAANKEGGEESNNKLAADLLSATHELKSLKEENCLLKKNYKTAHNKNDNLELQLAELQARLQAQNKDGGKINYNSSIVELQQQNSDLKSNLNDLARQNQLLEAELLQKQAELDCFKQNQNKILRVKEEIATKAEELQEIFATLENKQMQVIQLEKMVKQMEEQQDRSQAQRTRLEARIAHLELEAKGKNYRSRGFSIL